jgi:hypothetical protein
MTLDEALQEVDAIMRDSLAELISTLHRIAEPTAAEIAELERQQAAERARVERELRAWLSRGGETLQ